MDRADAFNNRLQKKNLSSGIITTQIGNDSKINELYRPEGIAIDTDNSIYVSDNNNRIQKFLNNQFVGQTIFPNSNTSYSTTFYLGQPKNLQLDSLNNLFIADSNSNRILKLNLNNNSIAVAAGGNGSGNSLNQISPYYFALSKTGNLFISDNFNNRIVKWSVNSLQGTTIVDEKMLGINFLYPSAIYLDKNENLYFGANYAIYKLPSNSKVPILAVPVVSILPAVMLPVVVTLPSIVKLPVTFPETFKLPDKSKSPKSFIFPLISLKKLT